MQTVSFTTSNAEMVVGAEILGETKSACNRYSQIGPVQGPLHGGPPPKYYCRKYYCRKWHSKMQQDTVYKKIVENTILAAHSKHASIIIV
jgi:hypothetical protein